MHSVLYGFFILVLTLSLPACSGGGSGSEAEQTEQASDPATSIDTTTPEIETQADTTEQTKPPVEPQPDTPTELTPTTDTTETTETTETSAEETNSEETAGEETPTEPEPPVEDDMPEQVPILKSVHLQWPAPTTRANGDPLPPGDISAYKIYYYAEGTNPDEATIISIDDPETTETDSPLLAVGTYYFSIASVDTDLLESELSEAVPVTIE